jgi:hypothetical protein
MKFISSTKGDTVTVVKQTDLLYDEIEKKANEYHVPASDAKVDPIWKAIPGYNGIEVDIGASYEKMKKDGKFNEEKLVFKHVKPLIHLDSSFPIFLYEFWDFFKLCKKI